MSHLVTRSLAEWGRQKARTKWSTVDASNRCGWSLDTLQLLSCILLLLLSACCVRERSTSQAVEHQARALESRLLAPCCHHAALAHHDSPVAAELRAELRERLQAGQSESEIEADLLTRYGRGIRSHLSESTGVKLVLVTSLLGGLLLLLM